MDFDNKTYIKMFTKWLKEYDHLYEYMTISFKMQKSKEFDEIIGVCPTTNFQGYFVIDKNKFFLAKIKFGI